MSDSMETHPNTIIGGRHDGQPAMYGQIDVGGLMGELCDDRGPRVGEDGTRCRRSKGHQGKHSVGADDGFGVVTW